MEKHVFIIIVHRLLMWMYFKIIYRLMNALHDYAHRLILHYLLLYTITFAVTTCLVTLQLDGLFFLYSRSPKVDKADPKVSKTDDLKSKMNHTLNY